MQMRMTNMAQWSSALRMSHPPDSPNSGNASYSLGTHSSMGLPLTNIFPPWRVKYFLCINCCTLALKVLHSSVKCHADPAWYLYFTLGSYSYRNGFDDGLRYLEPPTSFEPDVTELDCRS